METDRETGDAGTAEGPRPHSYPHLAFFSIRVCRGDQGDARRRATAIKFTYQLIEGHLWAVFIEQVPPCGSTHCSKTHISCRADSHTYIRYSSENYGKRTDLSSTPYEERDCKGVMDGGLNGKAIVQCLSDERRYCECLVFCSAD